METLHFFILGLVQGLTEFLPISSSAHLILLPRIAGWEDQGLAHDVAAHLGTLAAVCWYLRADLGQIAAGYLSASPETAPGRRLGNLLVMATVPIVLAGLLLHDVAATSLRDPLVIALATIGFGLLLAWADHSGKRVRGGPALIMRDALLIGLSQCLAIIPGTSRSGITITAGLMLGLNRAAAARFSFLLSVPTILLAGVFETWQWLGSGQPVPVTSMTVVALVSAASALLTLHFFIRFINRTGMLPYVVYRLSLGTVLLVVFH